MKRQRRSSYHGGRYPSLETQLDRRTVLRGLGGLGVLSVAATTGGCIFQEVAGDMPAPDWYDVVLPGSGVRTLYFPGDAFIDYHVNVVVDTADLQQRMRGDEEALLQEIDDAFSTHAVQDFDPEGDGPDLHLEVADLLAAFYADDPGSITSCTVTIDAYDEGQEIDGDIEP